MTGLKGFFLLILGYKLHILILFKPQNCIYNNHLTCSELYTSTNDFDWTMIESEFIGNSNDKNEIRRTFLKKVDTRYITFQIEQYHNYPETYIQFFTRMDRYPVEILETKSNFSYSENHKEFQLPNIHRCSFLLHRDYFVAEHEGTVTIFQI
jgi:hypothetical protein